MAVIAYAIYRFNKDPKGGSSISYERILNDAINEVKKNNVAGEYTLVIFPPKKSMEFVARNPDFFKELKISSLKNKLLVVWFVQFGENVLGQKAIVGKELATDFKDIIPTDKIYKKKLNIR